MPTTLFPGQVGRDETHVALTGSNAITLLVAAAACAAGALLPPMFATIVASILLVSGIVAFALRRADHVLDAIFKEELSPAPQTHSKKTA